MNNFAIIKPRLKVGVYFLLLSIANAASSRGVFSYSK